MLKLDHGEYLFSYCVLRQKLIMFVPSEICREIYALKEGISPFKWVLCTGSGIGSEDR